jgi:hypothetical protein
MVYFMFLFKLYKSLNSFNFRPFDLAFRHPLTQTLRCGSIALYISGELNAVSFRLAVWLLLFTSWCVLSFGVVMLMMMTVVYIGCAA